MTERHQCDSYYGFFLFFFFVSLSLSLEASLSETAAAKRQYNEKQKNQQQKRKHLLLVIFFFFATESRKKSTVTIQAEIKLFFDQLNGFHVLKCKRERDLAQRLTSHRFAQCIYMQLNE